MDKPTPVRISKIAGRYLVFDSDGISLLRRQESISGTLAGTTPQQPTQNQYLGLPIELRPEEAEILARKKVAYIVDDVAAHQAAFRSVDSPERKQYIQSLRKQKQRAQAVLAESVAEKAAQYAQRSKKSRDSSQKQAKHLGESVANETLFDDRTSSPRPTAPQAATLAITPTPGVDVMSLSPNAVSGPRDAPESSPLLQFFKNCGYYTTPGLRFGARYSVYPGDPLRFHAHHMANEYSWDEEIPILDVVGGGRLATAVKKSLLIGGQKQSETDSSDENTVKLYSIEWAAM
ncbi:hypothetical protein S7711_01882 [Stachybotrys chartarum IBT 7711]|uniref:tRNA-splicing endonuclease subunit Sen34 n=1 Tax=Stachybotrys chartarum (strain CBS 109288 / IBT 7711) TaxID=1280523 RepID=A0A084AMQ9_STACB|nr:hypothetical protein S7711_01882 [Stachybotrys chartarum IBT 7711]KFA48727.1 hypothetical protein S40293_01596 [Stachybotrys chartarum IBT 40293]